MKILEILIEADVVSMADFAHMRKNKEAPQYGAAIIDMKEGEPDFEIREYHSTYYENPDGPLYVKFYPLSERAKNWLRENGRMNIWKKKNGWSNILYDPQDIRYMMNLLKNNHFLMKSSNYTVNKGA